MHGGYQNSSYNTVVSEPPEDEGRIDYILLCYQFFSIYIVISMLILLVWDVYFVFKTILLSKDMTQVLLQMYNPVFALIAIGIEADLTDILRGNALMQSWTFRGQSYFFIGLLNKAQFRCPAWTVSSITMLYNSILSGNFMVIGVIYLCLVSQNITLLHNPIHYHAICYLVTT
jgi:hypothetical protein